MVFRVRSIILLPRFNYFNKLLYQNKIENYRQNKICTDIEVWADLASVLLEKKYYDFHRGLSLNEEDEHKKIFY